MPPTIQTNLNTDRDKRPPRPGEKRSELVTRVKYCNTLPDIPFDLKFITYPFESGRFIQYNPTSLERNYKYEVLTEHDLGVTIDLINKDLYTPEYGQLLDPADEKLLEEDSLTPQDSKRSRHHGRSVSWLRRTEYISTEQTRFQPQTMDKVEAKVGYSIKKNFKDDTLYMDRSSQIKAIEKTFDDSKKPIDKHYSKPNVVPVEILPVFPDFKLWKYPCAQVIFDSDPAPIGRPVPAQIEEMSQAMIRGVMDESGEQFVAYFLPTETTLDKRRVDFLNNVEYVDDMEYDYKMAREYNWNVKSKASKGYEENYFLVMRQDGAYYNELETRVRLSKRRQKAGQQVNNTRLVVCHRTLNATEFKMQRYREKQLEPTNEEEDEEDEEEEEEEEPTQEQNNEKSDDDNDEKADSKKESQAQSDMETEDNVNNDREEDKNQNNDSDKEKEDERDKHDSDKENDSDKEESDHEKGEIDNEKDESEHEKEGSVNGMEYSENEKEESENEKDNSENEKDNSENEKDNSENEKDNSENEREDSEHGKEDSEHGKEDSENEKNDSENDRDGSENEKDNSENEKEDSEKERADSESERVESNNEKEESEKEESDEEQHNDNKRLSVGSEEARSPSSSGSESVDKAEGRSRSSRSRSSSRSQSQPRQRSGSRSASPSGSGSASGSDSE